MFPLAFGQPNTGSSATTSTPNQIPGKRSQTTQFQIRGATRIIRHFNQMYLTEALKANTVT